MNNATSAVMMDELCQVKLTGKHIDNDVVDFVAEIAELAIAEVMTTELTFKSTNLSQFGHLF
jgi:hypothetical protein